MSLVKIDGLSRKEEDSKINLHIREEDEWGVQIDVHITPLFCLHCDNQLDGFFHHGGSRYGYVDSIICNHCNSKITCTDSDNIVEYLNIYTEPEGAIFDDNKKIVLDYYKLYKLEKQNWIALRSKTGYDIFTKKKGQRVTLNDVINEICEENRIELGTLQQIIPSTDKKIKKLPNIINKWIQLLDHFEINV